MTRFVNTLPGWEINILQLHSTDNFVLQLSRDCWQPRCSSPNWGVNLHLFGRLFCWRWNNQSSGWTDLRTTVSRNSTQWPDLRTSFFQGTQCHGSQITLLPSEDANVNEQSDQSKGLNKIWSLCEQRNAWNSAKTSYSATGSNMTRVWNFASSWR